MARVIRTEAEMQRIRESIQFCYLCGEPLRVDGVDRRLNREDVIPRALFGPPPEANTWRPILLVHQDCHETIKNQSGESLAIELHKLFLEGDRGLDGRGFVPRLLGRGVHPEFPTEGDAGEIQYPISGVGNALTGVWHWVRGLHATLYRQFLPLDALHHIFPPWSEIHSPDVPAESRKGAKELYDRKMGAFRILDAAVTDDNFDGIVFWGKRCVYAAAWFPDTFTTSPKCVWTLRYDGIDSYGEGTPFGAAGWSGWYDCAIAPTDRAVVQPVKD